MSISDVHPHDARMSELKFLVVIILCSLAMISVVLYLGMGQPNLPIEALLGLLGEVNPFAIPMAITVAVGMAAYVTNSTFYEQWFNVDGCTPGETAFIVIGTWMGATLALSINLGGRTMHTPQELVFALTGITTVLFGLLVAMTRNYR